MPRKPNPYRKPGDAPDVRYRRAEAKRHADELHEILTTPEAPGVGASRDQIQAEIADIGVDTVRNEAQLGRRYWIEPVVPIVRPKQLSGEQPVWPPPKDS